ncbi:MAG: hypothetical protein ACPG4Z_08510 [Chitinophagales bacterium]
MKKMMTYIMMASLGIFLMGSCAQTHNCPTYATSGPSKIKKQKKKNGIGAGSKRDKKMKKKEMPAGAV